MNGNPFLKAGALQPTIARIYCGLSTPTYLYYAVAVQVRDCVRHDDEVGQILGLAYQGRDLSRYKAADTPFRPREKLGYRMFRLRIATSVSFVVCHRSTHLQGVHVILRQVNKQDLGIWAVVDRVLLAQCDGHESGPLLTRA